MSPIRKVVFVGSVGYGLALPLALFYPFRFNDPREVKPNSVRWLQERPGLEFSAEGMACSAQNPLAFYKRMAGGNGFTFETIVTPFRLATWGRIFTLSPDCWIRNLTIDQRATALQIRLRTAETDLFGYPVTVVEDVFEPDKRTHLTVTYDLRTLIVYVDGRERSRNENYQGALGNWNRGYPIVIGNDYVGNRAFIGSIHHLAIYRRALDPPEVFASYSQRADSDAPDRPVVTADVVAHFPFTERGGSTIHDHGPTPPGTDLKIPATLRTTKRPFLVSPYRSVSLRHLSAEQVADIVVNVLLFVPFGAIVMAAFRKRWSTVTSLLAAVLAAFVFSLVIEVLQFYVSRRVSTLTDVVNDSIGAFLGAAIVHRGGVFPCLSRTTATQPSEPSRVHCHRKHTSLN